ncbi:VCBS repeat-containing protein [Bradyrhizobium sp. USDA 4474]
MTPTSKREIAFIDPGVEDLETLLHGIRSDVEPILLSSDEPASRQMARAIRGSRGLEAIHIIAHGRPGELAFSAGLLSLDTIDREAGELVLLGDAIGQRGELRLWSCAVARSEQGAAFVRALANVTGAKVAASERRVGAAARGGRWELASIATMAPCQPPITTKGQRAYAGVLDTSNTTISGNNSTNALTVTGSNDKISDGNGTNTVTVTGNSNTVSDGNGTNAITVTGNNDSVSDGNGTNTITVTGNNNVISDGNGSNTIIASGNNATISDGNGGNLIYAAGTSGTNSISDGNGTNVIVAGSGTDTIVSGNGANIIYAGAGNDTINVGNGTDVIIAGSGSDVISAGNGSDLAIYALSDHYKVVNVGGSSQLQSLAGDVDKYNGGGGTDTIRIVVTADEYALIKSQLTQYANWLAANQCSSASYSFNFAAGTSGTGASTSGGGLVLNGWEALQVQIVNPGTIGLAVGATSSSGSLNSLNLFTNTLGTSSTSFTDTFKIVGVAAGNGAPTATSLDPSLNVAQYLQGTASLPTSYTVAGTDGKLTVYADGTYSYTVTSFTTATDVFTLSTLDQNGFVTSTTLTFGMPNHGPTIVAGSTTATGAFSELSGQTGSTTADSASGSIAFADVDLSDTHTVSQGTPGFAWSGGSLTAGQISALTAASTLTLTKTDSTGSGSGSVAWGYSAQDKSFDFLAAGQTLTVTYAVSINDGHGGTTSQNVMVTIAGTNDTPVITSGAQTGAITEVAGQTGATSPDSATGTVTFSDADLSDTHSVTITGVTSSGVTSGLADNATLLSWLTLGTLTDSTNGVTGSDGWSFAAQDKSFDYLAAGQTVTLTYTVQVADTHGGTTSQNVVVTITGTNDAPSIVAGSTTATGAFSELSGQTGSTTADSASGSIAFADVDLSDTHTVSQGTPSFAWSGGSLTAGQISALTAASTLTLTKTDSIGSGSGSVAWGYSAQDKSFDFLAAGQTLTVTYAVSINDGHGGTTSQNVVVTIAGTNDTPVITSSAQGAALSELTGQTGSTSPDSATGTVTFSDADLSDTHSVTITGVTSSGVTSGLADNATLLSWLTLGTLTDSTNGVTGSDGWSFAAQDKSFDYLAQGESVTLTYTVQVADTHGGTTSQNVVITITGTNDAPVITSGAQTGAITEVAGQTGATSPDSATGTVTFSDADLSDTHSVTITGVTSSGVTSGLADNATLLSWLTLGTLTDSTNGVTGSDGWSFAAQDKSFDYLAQGESVTLTYTVQVADTHGGTTSQNVVITITGTNDAPSIVAGSTTATGAFSELSGQTGSTSPDSATGTVTFSDADLSDTHSVTITGVTSSGVTSGLADNATLLSWLTLGTLTDSTNGVTGSDGWSFAAQDKSFDYLAQGESVTLTYTVQVADTHGGTTSQNVVVTITGTNDAPSIVAGSSTATGAFSELSGQTGSTSPDSATGTVTFSDADRSDTHSVTITGVTSSGVTSGLADNATMKSWLSLGALSDATGGVTGSDGWSFAAQDKSFDYLAQGESVTLTYTVEVADTHGGTTSQNVVVTITGTNDTPVITSGAQTGAITELAGQTGSTTNDTASGAVTFTDADLSDTHTATVTGVSTSGTTSGLPTNATLLSWLSLGALSDATGGVTGSDGWSFAAQDKSFDYLAQGESVTLTYTVEVADTHGGTTSQNVVITITGTNDQPVITSGAQTGAITEVAGQTGSTTNDTASGAVTFTDADLSDTHTATVTGVSTSGTTSGLPTNATLLSWLTVGTLTDSTNGVTGSDGWSFAAQDKSFDYLAQGESVTLTYTVEVADTHGGTTSQNVVVTITGTNDQPVITSSAQGAALSELTGQTGSTSPDSATGTVTFSDADLSDTHSVTITGVTSSGVTSGLADNATVKSWLSLGALSDATGGVTGSDGWSFAAQDKSFDYLAQGESVTLTYTVEVADTHGGTTSQNVVVTITGTNDAPSIVAGSTTATGAFSELSGQTGSTSPDSATGTVTFSDADLSDTHTATVTGVSTSGTTSGLPTNATLLSWLTLGTLTDSTNGVTGSDGWSFAAQDKSFDYLAQGESVTLTYTVEVADNHGGTTSQNVVITITGTNDQPVITSSAQGAALSELTGQTGSTTNDTASGAVAFTDADLSDTHTATVTGVSTSGTTSGLPTNATLLSWLSLGALSDATGGVTGSDGWSFAAQDKSFDYLAQGESVTLTYTVEVADTHGGTTSQNVVITITGTNDQPVITSSAQGAALSELTGQTGSTTNDTASGAVTFSDADLSDTHSVTITGVTSSGVTSGLADNATVKSWLSLGALSDATGGVTGSDGWSFAAQDKSFDYLAQGESVTLTYTVEVADTHGGTTSQNVVITITGTNDQPVITSSAQGASLSELTGQTGSTTNDTASGAVTFTDADLSDTHTATVTGVSTSGTTSGLPTNATLLSWLSLGALSDATGGVTGSDGWSFAAQDKSFDYLAQGESVTLTYTVEVADTHGGTTSQNVVITITGTNDQPVITSGAQTGAITEVAGQTSSTTNDTASGAVTFTDADLIDTHTATVTGVSTSGTTSGLPTNATLLSWLTLGTLTDSTNGVTGSDGWSFAAQDKSFDYLAQGESVTLTYTVEVADTHGGTTSQNVVITITGTNDAPVITSGAQTGAITEVAGQTGSTSPDSATGAVTFSDADLSDTHSVTITGVTSSGVTSGLADNATVKSWLSLGALSDATGGVTGSDGWSFAAQDKSFDYLAQGESVTLTYTVEVADTHGGTTSQNVVITITGTNDQPVITSGAQTGAITEVAGQTGSTSPDSATGTVTFSDADLSDTHSVTITGVTSSGVTSGLADNATLLSWLTLGTLTDSTNGVTGSDGWSFAAQDKSFDYLAQGESVTLTYTVQVADTHGGTTSQNVVITITGTNDAPSIVAGSTTATGAFSELSGQTGSTSPDSATGTVTFSDADLSDTHSVTITGVTSSGVTSGLADNATVKSWLSLGALSDATGGVTGSDGWSFAAQDKSFDYLAQGESVTLTYTVEVADTHGGTTSQNVVVTITGTNDAPSIVAGSTTATGAFSELSGQTGSTSPDSATGTVTFSDADLSDTHSVTITGVTSSGVTSGLADNATVKSWLSLGALSDATGGVTGSDGWSFAAQDKSFDYLAAGQTVTLTYTVEVADTHGGTTSQNVVITITGTNDQPVITSSAQGAALSELTGQTGSTTNDTASGAVTFSDADLSDTHSVTITGVTSSGVTSGLADNATVKSWLSLGALSDATGGVTGSDGWSFAAQDKSFDYLAQGESVTLTYTVEVADTHGGTTSQNVVITITGTNDQPVITSSAQGASLSELTGQTGSTTNDTASGAVTFTDADLSDTHTATVTGVSTSGTTSGLPTNATLLSWLTLGTLTDSTNGVTGSDGWSFAAQDKSFDYLAAGQTVTLTYTVQVADTHGGTTSQNVVVTITGTNDAPSIVAGSTTATGAFSELSGQTGSTTADSASGSIAFADVDLSDSHTVSQGTPSFAWSGGSLTAGQISALTAASTLTLTKTDSTGSGSGSVAWGYSAQDKSFDFLAAGQTLTVTYAVSINDGHGGTTSQNVVVTIAGTNDTPVITSGAQTGAITELAGQTGSTSPDSATGTVTFSDADLSDTHSVTITGVTSSGVTSGLADNATVKSWLSLGALSDATGGVTGSDGWSFAAQDKSFDYLAQGESVTLTYTVQVADAHGGTTSQNVVVTITGTNDTPVITSGAQGASLSELTGQTGSTTNDTASGAVTFTDADLSDTHTATVTGVSTSGTTSGLPTNATLLSWLSLGALSDATGGVTGSDGWSFAAQDKSFDYLAAGQTVTLTYTVQVADTHGGTTSQNVVITITGTNDQPVITSSAQGAALSELTGQTGSTTNDTASGAVTFTDVDLSDTHTATVTGVSTSGTTSGLPTNATLLSWLTLGTLTDSTNGVTGSDGWSFSAQDKSFDYLAQGESVTLTYTVEVADTHGGTTSQNVVVTITGTNDTPVITSGAQTGAITELAGQTGSTSPDSATGTVTFSDADLSDTHSVTITGVTSSGVTSGLADNATVKSWLSLGALSDATGGVTGSDGWSFSAQDKSFDYLAQGESVTLTYTVEVADTHGGTTSQNVVITITGTNDTPVITSGAQTGAITEVAGQTGSTSPDSATGTVTFSDADLSDTHSVTITGVTSSGVTSGLADNATVKSWLSLGALSDATGGVTGSDGWSFSAQDKSFDYLAQGENVTLTYTVQVADTHGGTTSQNVVITITGTNDQPVITSRAQGASLSELTGQTGSTTNDTASGAVTFTDSDLSDTHIATVTGVTTSGTTSGLPTNATLLSWLSLGALSDATGGVTGSDGWSFAAQDKSFDYLAAGQTVTLTYTVQVADTHGGTTSQNVVITITGTNDQPVITSSAQGAALSELTGQTGSTTNDTASGAVTFSDADLSDTHSVTITGVTSSGVTSGLADNATVKSWLSLGALSDATGGVTGSDGWSFAAQDKSFDYLAQGESVTLTYTVQVADTHGGTTSQNVVITITGTNDQPVITSSAQGAALSELTGQTGSTSPDSATGTVTFSDADLSDTHSVTITGVTSSGVTSGLADNATVKSWLSLGALSDATGGVTGSDGWSFAAQDKSFDYLAQGESVTLTYTVEVADTHGGTTSQNVVVTITGTNDQPVITSSAQGASLSELTGQTGSTTNDTASGAVTFTDADLSDTHTATVTGVSTSGTTSGLPTNATLLSWLSLGALSDATGGVTGSDGWSFAAQDKSFDYLAAGQTVTLTYTVQVADTHGGTTSQNVVITITGTNDAPVITSGAQTGAITEVAGQTGSTTNDTASGAVTFTDADLSDTHTATVTGVSTSGTTSGLPTNATLLSWLTLGTLTDSTNGVTGSDGWSFAAQDKSFDYLAAGQTVTLTYTVQVADTHGGTTSQNVVVTITGTNDAPSIVAGSTTATGAFSELSGQTGSTTADSASGSIAFADVDLSDSHTVSQGTPSFAWSGGSLTAGQISALTAASTLTLTKTDSIGSGSGSVAWGYSAQDKSFDFLAAGQTLTVTYAVSINDGHGGTTSQNVVVTIAGTNDTPVITSGAQTGAITELAGQTGSTTNDTASGAVTFTDADLSDTHTATVTGVSTSGTTSGLPTNATLLSWLTLGTLTDSTNGVTGSDGWSFAAQDKSFDYLAAGQTVTLTYTVQVADTHGGTTSQNVVVTITGTNDAPSIVAGSTTATGAFSELSGQTGSTTADSASGSIAFADVDLSDSHTVSQGTPSFAWSGGSLTAGQISALTAASTLTLTQTDSTGSGSGSVAWGYSAQDKSFDFLAAGQTLTATYAVSINDGHGGTTSQNVVVTITGTNDTPVITSGAQTGAITEVAGQTGSTTNDTASGAVTFTDADLSDTHTATVTGVTTSGTTSGLPTNATLLSWLSLGALSDATGGVTGSDNWSFAAQDKSFDYLAAGQTVTLTYTVQVADTHGGTTSQNVVVTITGTDDAPVNTVPSNQSMNKNGSLVFSSSNHNQISISDVDNASHTVTLSGTFSGGSFTITLGSTTGLSSVTGNGTSAVTLSGTDTAINNALSGMHWDPQNGKAGSGGLTIQTSDGSLSATSTIGITVQPAGVSGSPIDLGLENVGSQQPVTLELHGVPIGWALSGGIEDSQGNWSILTTDPGSVTTLTPTTFVGAQLLSIVQSWTDPNGNTFDIHLLDNVEAYAPGTPIFAWSGNDTLTGSSGHDTFVFSQPIGNDVVHSFDVSSDVIDLISYGWQSFADVQAHTADDANGNALITLADGQTITLDGVHAADLTAANFEFDVTPTVENPGAMTIGDGAMLPLSGIIHNTGTIELHASGDDTLLQLIQTGITLDGGGQVVLSDDDHNVIAGTAPNVTLDNVDNVISGAGQIGQGSLMLSNQGTIDATGTHALVIDTGANVIANAGTLEAAGSGGLVLESAVANNGQIWANGGNVTAEGEVTGNGNALISGAGTIEFGAGSTAGVAFDTTAAGHLILDDAFHFSGTVSGLTGNDDIDIKGIGFGAGTTVSFIENQAGTGGTLTVSDGAHAANIVLLGQYDPTGFTEKADTTNGTLISYDPHHIV